jgi:hypothetical protein
MFGYSSPVVLVRSESGCDEQKSDGSGSDSHGGVDARQRALGCRVVGTGGRKVRGTTRRFLLGVAVLVAVAASAIGVAPPAHAATGVSETPDRTWNTNGTVFDTELSDDGSTLYIGGKFTSVRENPPASPAAASPRTASRP